MIEALAPSDIENNIDQYFNVSHKSVYEKNILDITKNERLPYMMTNLRSVMGYLEGLIDNHEYMGLTDSNIDHMVAGLDAIIEDYKDIAEKTSKNSLEAKYYDVASEFLDVVVAAQVELGFYKVERKAV